MVVFLKKVGIYLRSDCSVSPRLLHCLCRLFSPMARAPLFFSPLPSHTTRFAARPDFWFLFSVSGNLCPLD